MNKTLIWIMALVLLASIVAATEYCPASYQTSSVFVQYANLTPAISATVTLTLWNGSSIIMSNMGGGIYNYSYFVPAYNNNGSNTYINSFSSTNPTTSGAESFDIKSTCATTDGSTSYLPLIIAIGIILAAVFYLGLSLGQDHYPLKLFFLWVGVWLFVPLSNFMVLMTSVESLDARIGALINLFPTISLIAAIITTLYFMYLVLRGALESFGNKKNKNPLRLG